jgi:ferric enterobactin receptor
VVHSRFSSLLVRTTYICLQKPDLKIILCCLLASFASTCFSQNTTPAKNALGLIIGNVMDASTNKAIPGATVTLKYVNDSSARRSVFTNKNGGFEIDKISFAYYRLQFSGVGYAPLIIDSIHIRSERFDFNLGDVKLAQKASQLDEVIVYAEKPLIESKDGKITFNVGESALSAGSSTTELLKNMPLVSNDADGKILLKGKEPKILIDDKPTDLNSQQLADLLESLPGSSIEKIELMTIPPPQYANEPGGVINIVTRKGKIGLTGRVSVSYGSRGEGNFSGNASYRDRKFAVNVYAGLGANRFNGEGHSTRNNFYADSSNSLNTQNNNTNKSLRPNLRLSVDYELNKQNAVNFTTQFSSNYFNSNTRLQYTNINNNKLPYSISRRQNNTTGDNTSPAFSFNYNYKGKDPREVLRFIANYNLGITNNNSGFFQKYSDGNDVATGVDSTQRQKTNNNDHAYGLIVNYDKPVKWMNSLVSLGTSVSRNGYHNMQITDFLRKPDSIYINNPLLSSDFNFTQTVADFRGGITVAFENKWKFTSSLQAEFTQIAFDFSNSTPDNANQYWNFFPNFILRKDWQKDWNASLSYRKSIRRANIDELNPSISYSDPYNLRFGNPYLLPQLADNYDFNFGTYTGKYYGNIGFGYNKVKDIIQRLRTLITDGKTQTTYNNISDRNEYEVNMWGGYSFSRQLRLNISGGYSYNQYGAYDKIVNSYRDGGSFYSSLSYNITLTDRISFDGNLRYNSFANPQGRSRSNLSQNFGMQTKYFNKRLVLTINLVDLFAQQQYNTLTYGSNFNVNSISNTNTRNIRLSISYVLNKNKATISNRQRKQLIEKVKLKEAERNN